MHSGHMTASASRSAAARGLLGSAWPVTDAARQKIKEVPKRAKVVAGAEARIRHPQDAVALAPEHGNPRHPATLRGNVTHVGCEG